MKKIIIFIIITIILTGCNNNDLSQGATQKNTIVKNPPKNVVTYEIDENLIGRYVNESESEEYFEIKLDGGAEVSFFSFDGYVKYDELEVAAYYTDTRVILSFRKKSDDVYTFPANFLAIDFEGQTDYSSFTSKVYSDDYSDEKLKFVRKD